MLILRSIRSLLITVFYAKSKQTTQDQDRSLKLSVPDWYKGNFWKAFPRQRVALEHNFMLRSYWVPNSEGFEWLILN